MALGIPLPSADFGGGLARTSQNLMNQLMQKGIKDRDREQAERHFQEQLKLSKAAAGRAAANAELQHQLLKQKLDPQFALKQLQQKLDFIQGLGSQQNKPMTNDATQQNMFKLLMSPPEMEQGLGALMPPEETPQEEPQTQQPKNLPYGIDLDRVKQALTYQALGLKAPTETGLAYTGSARHAVDLARLKKDFGENSEEYQNAKAEYEAGLDAKKDLRAIRARTQAGLKPGEKEFFDETTGEPLGKEIPLTAKERESEEGNILFNELYPYVYNGASPFSGEGSIRRLENAARLYKTDPKARKLFDDFLLADKMLAATTVNEASTLKAGRTNRTYGMLKESLESQDIPKTIKRIIKEYQLPASAQLRASMRYQKLLSDARQKARKGTPASQRLYYNPEMQAQHQAMKDEGGMVKMTKDGEEYNIPAHLVEKALKEGFNHG